MSGPAGPVADLYAAAGVDVAAGDRAVQLMKASVARASRPEVVGGLGGFAGLFDASRLKSFRQPLLATSTDGVGTKVEIARSLERYDTIGRDLVGMLVDDLVVCGAEPLFVTDYIACGSVVPERIAAIVSGIADGCALAGAALVGGETAEHAGLLDPDEFDLAGATTGVVEADDVLGPARVRDGDVLVALASSGLHANGYVLVRKVFLADAGWRLDKDVPEFERTLGEELLEPTRIYALDVLEAIRQGEVHAACHVTGGGIAANLARVLPAGATAVVERSSWTPSPVFQVAAGLAGVDLADLESTLNLGIGMILVVAADSADATVALLRKRGVAAWRAGSVQITGQQIAGQQGIPTARLTGLHPA